MIIHVFIDLTRSVLGDSMKVLACIYNSLGRCQDALVLEEKILDYEQRVLSENHSDIGEM